MQEFVASLLEAAGRLSLLGAQVIYFSQPFLDGLVKEGQLHSLANMLENATETQAFIHYLREETQLWT
jgi:hypothetical protein